MPKDAEDTTEDITSTIRPVVVVVVVVAPRRTGRKGTAATRRPA
jgi:hypothetical protein